MKEKNAHTLPTAFAVIGFIRVAPFLSSNPHQVGSKKLFWFFLPLTNLCKFSTEESGGAFNSVTDSSPANIRLVWTLRPSGLGIPPLTDLVNITPRGVTTAILSRLLPCQGTRRRDGISSGSADHQITSVAYYSFLQTKRFSHKQRNNRLKSCKIRQRGQRVHEICNTMCDSEAISSLLGHFCLFGYSDPPLFNMFVFWLDFFLCVFVSNPANGNVSTAVCHMTDCIHWHFQNKSAAPGNCQPCRLEDLCCVFSLNVCNMLPGPRISSL